MYTLKETCEMTGVTPRTLRYYDEIGLLTPDIRKSNGRRFYGEESIKKLRIICELRSVNFGIQEIRQILQNDLSEIYKLFQHHQKSLIALAYQSLAMAEKTELLFQAQLSHNAYHHYSEDYALLMINIQNQFIKGTLSNSQTVKIVPHLRKLYTAAHEHNIPVIYISDTSIYDRQKIPTLSYADPSSYEIQIYPELALQYNDFLLQKYHYDAFSGTNLDYLLKQLKCRKLIIAGVFTDLAVYHTALSAWYKGYQLAFLENCTAGNTEEKKHFALESLSDFCGAIITDSCAALF